MPDSCDKQRAPALREEYHATFDREPFTIGARL
jgi:hypothetical protein